jgi:hypothetical protein
MYIYDISPNSSQKEKCYRRKLCRNQNTHFMFIKFLFEIHAVYEIKKNVIEPDRPQMAIHIDTEKMRFAFRITKARTDTHSYLLFLAFAWQKMVPRTRHKCYVIRTLHILSGS